MAVAYRSRSGPVHTGYASSIAVPKPSGAVQGDALVAVLVWVVGGTPSCPGWTLVRTDGLGSTSSSIWVHTLVKIAGASEPSSYTFAASEGGYLSGSIVRLDGVDTSAPIETHNGASSFADPGGTITAPGVSPAETDGLLLYVGAVNVGSNSAPSWTPPSGMTEAFEAHNSTAGNAAFEVAYLPSVPTGATGDKSATLSHNNNVDNHAAQLLVIRADHPPTTPGAFTAPTSASVWSDTHTVAWGSASDPEGDPYTYRLEVSTDNGATWSLIASGLTSTSRAVDFSGYPATTTAKVRVRAEGSGGNSSWRTSAAFTIEHNVAPNAPTGLSPSGGNTINRDNAQRFSWTFSDPDAGDAQSRYDLRHRPAGTSTWTTVSATTTNTFRDVAAGTFAAGDHEWQVRTYDSQGVVGPWSSSAYFTAASPPAGVSITSPTNGSTITSDTGQVAWSAPEQESFQVRKVADDGTGNPDTATVYYDSGEVVSATARNHGLTFPTNGRDEHLQVRVKVSGLWSGWASVRVTVSYTPPATPTLTVTPSQARGGNLLEWANPTPGAGEPAVTSMHVYRHEGDPDDEVRIAVVAPGDDYLDRTAAARRTYTYRAVAIGDNGTSTTSAEQTGTLTLSGVWLHPADDPDDARHYRANAEGGSRARAVEQNSRRFAGRALPVVEYGIGRTTEVSALLHLTDHDALEYLAGLQGRVVHYRDAAGRRLFGTIVDLSDDATFYGWDVDLEISAVDHDETVEP